MECKDSIIPHVLKSPLNERPKIITLELKTNGLYTKTNQPKETQQLLSRRPSNPNPPFPCFVMLEPHHFNLLLAATRLGSVSREQWRDTSKWGAFSSGSIAFLFSPKVWHAAAGFPENTTGCCLRASQRLSAAPHFGPPHLLILTCCSLTKLSTSQWTRAPPSPMGSVCCVEKRPSFFQVSSFFTILPKLQRLWLVPLFLSLCLEFSLAS